MMKTSLDEVKKFRQEMFDKSMSLVRSKGADYNRDQQEDGDTLYNLRVCELLGVVDTTEQGILVRLSDKFMRLISLTKEPGREAQVTDEKVRDTAADVHNYVDYLVMIYEKRRAALKYAVTKEELVAATYTGHVTPEELIDSAVIPKEVLNPEELVPAEPNTGYPTEVLTQSVTCLGCLGEQHVHSKDERCRIEQAYNEGAAQG